MKDTERWGDYYDNRNLCRNSLVKPWHRKRILTFLDFFSTLPVDYEVLDIGCGQGLYLEFLRNLGFKKVTGVDPSSGALSWAELKNLDVVRAGLFDYAPPHPVDVVIFSEIIEHLEEPEKALDRLMSWLKPGGIIYCSTPVMDSVSNRVRRLLLKESRLEQSRRIDDTHVKAFGAGEFESLFRSRGLEVMLRVVWYNRVNKIGEGLVSRGLQKFHPYLGDYMIVAARKKAE